jgi:Arc/MetJ family transcription regulator
MRINVVIDDELMENALRATGLKTKREVAELGLRTLIRLHEKEAASERETAYLLSSETMKRRLLEARERGLREPGSTSSSKTSEES